MVNMFRDQRQNNSHRINNFKEKSSFRNPTEKKFVMNEMEFPSILKSNNTKEEIKTTKSNYLEKIKTDQELPLEIQDILPGWVEIQYNSTNNTKNIQYGKSTKKHTPIMKNTFLDVLEGLNKQYISWKNNYIETWGEDEYTTLYKFSNYDYDYYDKLDENIMEEMEYVQEDDYE